MSIPQHNSKQFTMRLTTWYCKLRGDKIPTVGGTGENTPFAKTM